MKKNLLNILLFIFTILFLIFPLSIIFLNNLITTLITIVFLIGLYYYKPIKFMKIKPKYIPFIIFGLTFITRLFCVIILNDHIMQVSDFGTALANAGTINFDGRYYQVFSHWILYPTIVHYIFLIFGNSQLVALIFNCIIVSFISLFIYLLSTKIFDNKNIGIVGSLIYIFWPSNLLYVTIFTPDHVVALLLIITIYLISHFNKTYENNKILKNILMVILIGIITGISVFFKNFAPILLIAIVIMCFIELLQHRKIKLFLKKIILMLLLIISYSLTKQGTFLYIEYLVGDTVGRNIIPCYLNIGLNSVSRGYYNDEIYQMYFDELEKNNLDFNKTNTNIMKFLYKDIKENYYQIPSILYHKTVTSFKSDGSKLGWVVESIKAKNDNIYSKLIKKMVVPISHTYYIIIITLMMICLLANYKIKNNNTYLLLIFIFGVALLFLLTEAQGRYKYGIEPIMCVLASGGLYYYKMFIGVKKNEKLYKTNETKTLS